jgi:hypothetical protein
MPHNQLQVDQILQRAVARWHDEQHLIGLGPLQPVTYDRNVVLGFKVDHPRRERRGLSLGALTHRGVVSRNGHQLDSLP